MEAAEGVLERSVWLIKRVAELSRMKARRKEDENKEQGSSRIGFSSRSVKVFYFVSEGCCHDLEIYGLSMFIRWMDGGHELQ